MLAQMLAYGLILSWIDCCNAVFHGAPTYTTWKLQRLQNNVAGIVLQAPIRRSHATPLLSTLHWLLALETIDHKVALLTFTVAAHRHHPASTAYSRSQRTSTTWDDDRPL